MFTLAVGALKCTWSAGLLGAALAVAMAIRLLARGRNQA